MQHESPSDSSVVKMRHREPEDKGPTNGNIAAAAAAASSRPTSMSRQRIRELLERQREEDDRRTEKEERTREAFRPRSDRLLWVFR